MKANDEAEQFQPLGAPIKQEAPKPEPQKPEQVKPGIVRDPVTGRLGTNIPTPPNQ